MVARVVIDGSEREITSHQLAIKVGCRVCGSLFGAEGTQDRAVGEEGETIEAARLGSKAMAVEFVSDDAHIEAQIDLDAGV